MCPRLQASRWTGGDSRAAVHRGTEFLTTPPSGRHPVTSHLFLPLAIEIKEGRDGTWDLFRSTWGLQPARCARHVSGCRDGDALGDRQGTSTREAGPAGAGGRYGSQAVLSCSPYDSAGP